MKQNSTNADPRSKVQLGFSRPAAGDSVGCPVSFAVLFPVKRDRQWPDLSFLGGIWFLCEPLFMMPFLGSVFDFLDIFIFMSQKFLKSVFGP